MRKVKQIAPYFGWSIIAAGLVFCLGSLHAFAKGLDRITRDLELNSAPEASLVYDRHNNVIFSFASENRTTVPLAQVSGACVGCSRRSTVLSKPLNGLRGPRRAAGWLEAQAVKLAAARSSTAGAQIALRANEIWRKVRRAACAARIAPVPERQILEAYLTDYLETPLRS